MFLLLPKWIVLTKELLPVAVVVHFVVDAKRKFKKIEWERIKWQGICCVVAYWVNFFEKKNYFSFFPRFCVLCPVVIKSRVGDSMEYFLKFILRWGWQYETCLSQLEQNENLGLVKLSGISLIWGKLNETKLVWVKFNRFNKVSSMQVE